MSRIAHIPAAALVFALVGGTASAACQVEYKAKRDTPFKLFYEIATVNAPCAQAEAALRAQLAQKGLTLLKIISKKQK